MTNVVISYYIEVVNVVNTVLAVSFNYVTWIKPLPLPLAQFVTITSHSCGSLMAALGSAISCFQILYVIKFDLIYSLDPQLMGWRIFILLTSFIAVPNCIFGIFKTMQGVHVDKGVTLFTQDKYNGDGIQFLAIYSVFWTMSYLVLSFFAFVFLPVFYKNRPTFNNHLAPQRTISLQRYLLGASGIFFMLAVTIIMIRLNDSGRLSVDNLCSLFALVILLAYHLTERETRNVVRKHIFKFLKIEEPVSYSERLRKANSTSTSQKLVATSSYGTAVVQSATSTLIYVSSLNNDLQMSANISQPTEISD
jgi:hypothetical protein